MKIFKLLKPSSFASAERKDETQLIVQAAELAKELVNNSSLNMMPDLVAILNSDRQLIFANKKLLDFLHLSDSSSILGLRPGEVLGCVNSHNDSGGCGTGEYCTVCNAVKTILATQKNKSENQSECEVLTQTGSTYNLKIWAFPFGENVLFVMRDIADEVHHESLEHIFFHDLINIGSGLFGLLNMIKGNSDTFIENEKVLTTMASEILEAVNSQRDLLLAEKGNMAVHWEATNNFGLINSVVEMLSAHQVAANKTIVMDKDMETVSFTTDTSLLKRVLINMAKNALEASNKGETVSLKSYLKGDKIVFEVHNNGFIPKDNQLQMFNRSFTTKGRGRGFGTYSIRLLSENYLQGKASFNSDPETGTSFFVEYPIEPKTE